GAIQTKSPKPILTEAGVNDKLDFDIGGSALVATISPGLRTVTQHRSAVATALSDAASVPLSGAYDDVTHLFTFSKSSGTFNIRLTSSAPNRDRSGWRTLGYTGDTDLTGSLSYTGDTPVGDNPDEWVIRVDVRGFK